MKNFLIAASLVAVLTGCASTTPSNPIDNEISSAMLNQNIVQVVHLRPNFTAMTAGKVAFPGGLLGAMMTGASGNDIISQNNVQDPAIAIGRELVKELALTRGAKVVPSVITLESRDAAAIAAAALSRAPYVLDVETRIWNFAYFPTDWTHYRVSYVAQARLIDSATGKILADATCKRIPDSNVGAPSYDDLVGGAAAGLKSELAQATAQCIASLKTDLLNL
ncbi:MAG TPA: hypothetical protein VFS95_12490 [Telluria sp.]|nr:hypothetical protein [Telluria sp.]